jgi:hypothetical protein
VRKKKKMECLAGGFGLLFAVLGDGFQLKTRVYEERENESQARGGKNASQGHPHLLENLGNHLLDCSSLQQTSFKSNLVQCSTSSI